MTHHRLLIDGVQREDRDMEVDDCGLSQELGSPVLVVGLGGNGQDVRERQTRLVVGDQLGALRVVSASVEQPCKRNLITSSTRYGTPYSDPFSLHGGQKTASFLCKK